MHSLEIYSQSDLNRITDAARTFDPQEDAALNNIPTVDYSGAAYVIDVDRTTASPPVALNRLGIAMHTVTGIDPERIHLAASEVEASGRSFAPYSIVRELLHQQNNSPTNDTEATVVKIRDTFRTLTEPSILYNKPRDRSTKLFQKLDGVPSTIVSVAARMDPDIEWQSDKVSSISEWLGGVVILKPLPSEQPGEPLAKGAITAACRSPKDGNFYYQGYNSTGEHVVNVRTPYTYIVDDKPAQFTGLPPDCRGYLIRRASEKRTHGQRSSEIPPNVTVIQRLGSLSVPLMYSRYKPDNRSYFRLMRALKVTSFMPVALTAVNQRAA